MKAKKTSWEKYVGWAMNDEGKAYDYFLIPPEEFVSKVRQEAVRETLEGIEEGIFRVDKLSITRDNTITVSFIAEGEIKKVIAELRKKEGLNNGR